MTTPTTPAEWTLKEAQQKFLNDPAFRGAVIAAGKAKRVVNYLAYCGVHADDEQWKLLAEHVMTEDWNGTEEALMDWVATVPFVW